MLYWAIDPVWSPAGEQLAWVSDRGGWEAPPGMARYADPLYLWYSETWEAPPYLLPASEEVPVNIRGLPALQESPTFSPDGNQLAFVVDLDPAEIWIVDFNGGELTPLVQGEDAVYDAAWSPDGESIAFVSRHGNQNDI